MFINHVTKLHWSIQLLLQWMRTSYRMSFTSWAQCSSTHYSACMQSWSTVKLIQNMRKPTYGKWNVVSIQLWIIFVSFSSIGFIRYARTARHATPLAIFTNWQRSAALPMGNVISGSNLSSTVPIIISTFSEEGDVVIVPCGLTPKVFKMLHIKVIGLSLLSFPSALL